MMYLFHGSDVERVRNKAFAWVKAARSKEPNAPYLRLSAEEITETSLAEAAGAQGLFFKKTLVMLDDPFAHETSGALILASVALLAKSPNPIAILAPKLSALRVKKISAHALKVFSADRTDAPRDRGFNASLVGALSARDPIALWKEIVKAYRAGDPPEKVQGLLHWKARDLMQKGSSRYSKSEARQLSRTLIELASDARSGTLPLSLALERFALTLAY